MLLTNTIVYVITLANKKFCLNVQQLVAEPESDEPWKTHCQRHFEGKTPARGETWRNLFRRCEQERDHKIQKIARRIKRHGEKATPVRQAQVVESQLPGGTCRGASATTVIKKTIKNQITIRQSGSSTSSSVSTHGPTVTTTTKTIVIKQNNGSKVKPKTAPLMQKSMQLFKNRFRR